MGLLITIIVAVVIFCLLWYLIGLIPLPAPVANLKWILYAVLIIAAIVWLVQFSGIHL